MACTFNICCSKRRLHMLPTCRALLLRLQQCLQQLQPWPYYTAFFVSTRPFNMCFQFALTGSWAVVILNHTFATLSVAQHFSRLSGVACVVLYRLAKKSFHVCLDSGTSQLCEAARSPFFSNVVARLPSAHCRVIVVGFC